MNSKAKDPLLASAKVLVVLIQILAMFAMVMIAIGVGALLTVEHGELAAKIAEVGAPSYAYWLLIAALVLIFVMLGLAIRFFKHLSGIVDSVGEGDPFRVENADRLTGMGWISVAIHVLTIVLAALAAWFAPYADKAGHHLELGFDVELTGLLLTLILFILARVFRRGAEMRDELEGTV